MAIVVAVAGAGDIITGGLQNILSQSPDFQVMDTYPHFGRVPDVIVYDAGPTADDDGAALLAHLDQAPPTAPVVIVGRPLRPALAARAMAHGAAAQVSLESPADFVLETIRAVATGATLPLSTSVTIEAESGLTAREIEVLQLITSGHANTEIAARLHLSPNSIKSLVRKAYRKIGAKTRAQAVSWCMEHGYYGWREEVAE
jgi:DNA-binding NarL/FixJ family response regulator